MNRTKGISVFVWTSVACAALGLAAGQIASCAGSTFVVQQYAGPPRPKESIAILRLDGADSAEILSLDRERLSPVEKGVQFRIEMLPGAHEIDVVDPQHELTTRQAVRFSAEAGKEYRVIVLQTQPASGPAIQVAQIYEVDTASNAPVRAVPPLPASEAAKPAPPGVRAALSPSDGGSDAPATDAASAKARD